ncbi:MULTISPECIES: serine hydrolase domain-containing protein [unclassified Sphingomonas]|mgnify:FL=1|uniref:serine hydrolase domain-containing protein n=1 Tax=unclassified Sphingomonas TaxID=196159 RepID=UPI0009290F90|nr:MULTISPECIES: serine hydrolase domain-containing protein [unclassified Sphingomonas]MBN8846795.1 beta-lactamase family protein [Sphingomonas sp.]OJV33803.1 MAG: serine hydrolase [Sphingomonas sp. 67-36]
MRLIHLAGIGGALAAIAAGASLARQAEPAPAPVPALPTVAARANSLLPNMQALFDGYVADGKMPGVVGAFGFGDRPTLFVSAGRISDDANAAQAGPDSLWRVYSMTKPITGMAAMILVEEGKIGLDDPLSKYFPAFAKMRVLTSPDTSLDSVPAKNQITIRELLTHTAGLSYNIMAKGPLLKEYERLGILPGAVNAQMEVQARKARPATLAEFANRVAQAPLIAEPGTKWSYSIGLDVMGAVIEKASGMPFDRFVQVKLLDPLKMTSTFWTVPAGEAGRLSTNYMFVGDKRVPIDPGATSAWLRPPSFPYGGAGLVSSARDYDRFLHMLQDGGTLDGVRVMKPETAALAMSNLMPPGVTFGGLGDGTGGTMSAKMGFGAGGSVYLEDGPGGLPSKGTYGWGGAAGTIAWVDPAKKVRGTVMVQYFPSEKWPLRQEVVAALVKDVARFRR